MTLARMWRRQLFAASSAALIVPSAMIAALVALALGGGFSRLGVLGQVFSGPPPPSAGPLKPGGVTARTSGAAIPVIRVARTVANRPASGGARTQAAPAVTAPGTGVASTGLASSGGTIAPGGVTIRPITGGPPTSGSAPPPQPAPVSSSPSPSPNPGPAPSPRPTPVDTVVKAVTSVTSQVPAPVGPAITQTVQSAGTAADTLLSKLP
ncbi:MAG: hypothetical protein ACLP4R_23135 [Solirubrobacteraceae bacterium]